MDIGGYLTKIRTLHASGQTTEHSFRPALAALFQSIDPALTVINEPKHLTDVGAPDFVFNRGDVAIGWCEAKDIGKDVRKFAANDYSKGQKERYRKGLPNLIYTNGLDFEFLRDGEVVDFITIADLIPKMPARIENFGALENRLRDFASTTPLSITSSKKLAEMMAGKAAIIKDIMGNALVKDIKESASGATATDLIGQYQAFKSNLIHDITVEEFADIYAETIAYGLFAARLHDETPTTFTRGEALDLLPKSNPFLRELFIYIAGPNLDERLRRVIDELCNVFLATNMAEVLKNFGNITARQDPFLHFYEVFLAEYNPGKRKARGVWYTPEPVVKFIVRAVDSLLKSEFGLSEGLADTSKVTIDWDTGQNDPKTGKPATISKQVHRVQILDPATGTGTFLAEVVKLVAGRIKGIAPGQWSSYVEDELIPRIHGFELLMASYAMCHMKLDMILTGQGYKPSAAPPRLGVYLTNSLEDGERVEQTLPFMGLQRAIAEESKLANNIKRQTPIMCVIGNPPYNKSSQNMGKWIRGLIEPYKFGLNERKINLDEDYIKFLRLSEHLIEKNECGVLGFITNNSYLRGVTHRAMRKHLMGTFDKIFILNLHGDANQNGYSPDGSPDKSVFDIKQGVSIGIFVKNSTSKNKKDAVVSVKHLYGSRDNKNKYLTDIENTRQDFKVVKPNFPYYFFDDAEFTESTEYESGFKTTDLFVNYNTGVQTKRDDFCLKPTIASINNVKNDLIQMDNVSLRFKYGLVDDNRDWSIDGARNDIMRDDFSIQKILHRPFDIKYSLYTGRSKGFLGYPRHQTMRHMICGSNLALLSGRQNKSGANNDYLVTDFPSEMKCAERTIQSYQFPLYVFPAEDDLDQTIRANFDPKLYAKICTAAGLTGSKAVPDGTDAFRKVTGEARPDEVKVFDYIYGVLHCPAYRETYSEFLKIDFPRVPFPASPESFRTISEQGEALRRLHLMEDSAIGETTYPFHGEGDSIVNKANFEAGSDSGKVWINADQYFDAVPALAWEFHIGGYQPAQKWLKDRRGRALGWDDIRHYQKIIKVLAETDRIMDEIKLPLAS